MLTSNTYGYRKLPDKSLAIIEEEAQVKRKMYELCAGGLGSRCIARSCGRMVCRNEMEAFYRF